MIDQKVNWKYAEIISQTPLKIGMKAFTIAFIHSKTAIVMSLIPKKLFVHASASKYTAAPTAAEIKMSCPAAKRKGNAAAQAA